MTTQLVLTLTPLTLVSVAAASRTYTAAEPFLAHLDCGATTIDFDDLPPNTQLFDQYAGVHFGGTGRTWDAQTQGEGGTYESVPNVLFNYGSSPIEIQLDPPVDAFGWFNPSLLDVIKVEFFGAGDEPLGEWDMPSFRNGITFLGFISDVPIDRVRATGLPPQSNLTIFLDTMTFGSAVSCKADLDGSGAVDAADLALLLGSWGSQGSVDLDCSGVVDAADLAILLGTWGSCD